MCSAVCPSMTIRIAGAIADQASGGTLIAMAVGQEPQSQGASLAIFTVYAVVILAVGALCFRRYDVT